MKRTIVLILLGGLVLGLGGAGVYLFLNQKQDASTDVVSEMPTPTPKAALLTWDDPAGFTASYPEDVTVNKHDEDKENYAHVELTNAKHPGNLIIWVKDLPKNVTDTLTWGKMVSTPSSALSFDTTLGGKDAQKVLVSGLQKTVETGVVYDGVLWIVSATLTDEPYWQSVFDTVANSFTFKPVPGESEGSANTAPVAPADEGSYDEEEVLE